MMAENDHKKDGELGRPSYLWRKGQERRLSLIKKYADLKDKKILDVGCGEGLYLKRFKEFTNELYGVDIDLKKIENAKRELSNVKLAPAEKLPFPNDFFDLILFNEVLEHVKDDRESVKEAFRSLKSNGKIVIFAPNRFFPFETHGVYFGGKYHFGNIPFINYLPDFLRNKLAPHVRSYTKKDIFQLFSGLNYRILVFTQIYPGFDKIELKFPKLSPILKKVFYFLENTPLRIFGLSHFVIAEKL